MNILEAKQVLATYFEEKLRDGPIYDAPHLVKDYVVARYAGLEREVFSVGYLDSQFRLIEWRDTSLGTVDHTAVYPREIAREALLLNASAVIAAHNHPSGLAEPSVTDQLLTTVLKQCLSLVDIRLLDHLVVAGSKTVSFAERGLL
jgi:DNA repair protein RadC